MGKQCPPALQFLLVVLCGLRWPEADEDALRDAATQWRSLAGALTEENKTAQQAVRVILTGNSGPSIDAFAQFWNRFNTRQVPAAVALCNGLAQTLEEFAGDTVATKEFIVIQLEALAVEIGLEILGSEITFGLSDAAALAQAAITAGVIRSARAELTATIGKLAAKLALRGAAEALLGDATLQGLRAVNAGSPPNLSELFTTTAGGALGGLVTGPVSHTISHALAGITSAAPGGVARDAVHGVVGSVTGVGTHVASVATDTVAQLGATVAGNTAAAAAQTAVTGQPITADAILGGLAHPVLTGAGHALTTVGTELEHSGATATADTTNAGNRAGTDPISQIGDLLTGPAEAPSREPDAGPSRPSSHIDRAPPLDPAGRNRHGPGTETNAGFGAAPASESNPAPGGDRFGGSPTAHHQDPGVPDSGHHSTDIEHPISETITTPAAHADTPTTAGPPASGQFLEPHDHLSTGVPPQRHDTDTPGAGSFPTVPDRSDPPPPAPAQTHNTPPPGAPPLRTAAPDPMPAPAPTAAPSTASPSTQTLTPPRTAADPAVTPAKASRSALSGTAPVPAPSVFADPLAPTGRDIHAEERNLDTPPSNTAQVPAPGPGSEVVLGLTLAPAELTSLHDEPVSRVPYPPRDASSMEVGRHGGAPATVNLRDESGADAAGHSVRDSSAAGRPVRHGRSDSSTRHDGTGIGPGRENEPPAEAPGRPDHEPLGSALVQGQSIARHDLAYLDATPAPVPTSPPDPRRGLNPGSATRAPAADLSRIERILGGHDHTPTPLATTAEHLGEVARVHPTPTLAPANDRTEPGAIAATSQPDHTADWLDSDSLNSAHHQPALGTRAAGGTTAPDPPTRVLPAAMLGPPRLITPIGGDDHLNQVDLVVFADGTHAVYKPVSGEWDFEDNPAPEVPRLDPARRAAAFGPSHPPHAEVAAHRLDTLLEFDLVPETHLWEGPDGLGSLQAYAGNAHQWYDEFTPADEQRMAVLDYIMANTDRHDGNFLANPHGRPIAIDHGYCFPATAEIPIRSDFVAQHLEHELSPEVWGPVRTLDTQHLENTLRACGLRPRAIRGAMRRLREVQRHKTIIGAAWPGQIVDGAGEEVLGAQP